jgi:hypothetical protein
MAKMTKQIRRVVFEKAINKIYGPRLTAEKEAFENAMEAVIQKMVQRVAKKNGVNYEELTTTYVPYIATRTCFGFQTNSSSYFRTELEQVFYNEHSYVLQYEDVNLNITTNYRQQKFYEYRSRESYPSTNEDYFSEGEKKEIIAIFKKYGIFMSDVISSACAIRDIINSAATSKQLIETSPELGELLPEAEICTALVPVETVKKVSALFAKA